MTTLINQDSFGNTYLGYCSTVDSCVSPGASLNPSTAGSISALLTAAYGSSGTLWIQSGNNFYIRFPIPYEQLTGNVTTSANWRLRLQVGYSSGGGSQNVRPDSSLAPLTTQSLETYTRTTGNYTTFGIANDQALSIIQYTTNGTGSLDSPQFAWYIAGWPIDPVYPTGDSRFVRNFVAGPWTAWWSNRENSNSTSTRKLIYGQGVLSPAITCLDSTPSPVITDICLINNGSGNICLGKLPNTLAYLHGGQPAKKLIKVVPDPYGNTEQNIWVQCVRQSNYDYYQRIWTENTI